MKYAQLVMGPAGSGKSTFCQHIQTHCTNMRRTVHVVNLDPAAEHFTYQPSVDVRELITLDDVAEELKYGPNGGLVYCMEFLVNNLEWLEEQLGSFEEDYLIIDCPGQIELYTHFPIMQRVKDALVRWGYAVCAVYIIDAQFVEDPSKFFSGTMSALAAMMQLEVPHINILSKMDLFRQRNRRSINRYLEADTQLLLRDINEDTSPKFHNLNRAIASLIDEYSMVGFIPLNLSSEQSINYVLSHIDTAMQYGENEEPKEPKDLGDEDNGDDGGVAE